MTAQSKLIAELEAAKKHQQRQNYKTNYQAHWLKHMHKPTRAATPQAVLKDSPPATRNSFKV